MSPIAALLLASPFVSALPQGQVPVPAIEREWTTRRWALDADGCGNEIASALSSASWQERHAALDALARAPVVAPWLLELAGPLVDDGHPNVRAAALAVLANGLTCGPTDGEATEPPPGVLLPAHRLHVLAADRLPDVRRSLARYLGRHGRLRDGRWQRPPETAELLLSLTADGDAAVEEVARRELLALGPGAEDEQEALFLALLDGTDSDSARRAGVSAALLALARSPGVSADLLARLAQLAGDQANSATRLSLRGQVEALRWIHTGEGSAETLAAGWLAGEAEPHRVSVRVLLVWGARAAGEPVARALLARVANPGSVPPEELADTTPEEALSLWIDGVLEAVLPSVAVELGLSPDLVPGLTPGASSALWDRAGLDARAWTAETLASWLDRVAGPSDGQRGEADPWTDTRLAIVNALAGPLLRTGDTGSGDILVRFLSDPAPQVAQAAFRALCVAPASETWFDAMRRFWAGRDRPLQLALLELLPRRPAATPFRDDLLALGAVPATRTVSVVELLGRFSGDAEVRAALDSWLEESLLRMEAAREAAAFRRAENRARGALRAFLAVQGAGLDGGAVERVLAVLNRTQFLVPPQDPRTPDAEGSPGLELPKTCAAGLGRAPTGMDALERLLGPDGGRSLSRRVRVEAEIILAGAGRLPGPGSLADDYGFCDGALRLRILRALAFGAPSPEAEGVEEFLLTVAKDRGFPLEQRMVALESLGSRAGRIRAARAAHLRDDLVVVLRGAQDLDLRRIALGQLEHLEGGGEAIRTFGEELGMRLATLGAGPEREEAEILWGDALVAGARADGLAGREHLCLSRPLARAGEDLAARFRGDPTAGVGFVWRSELEAAEELARRGHLGAALHGQEADWSKLDGRLLFALAEEALGGPDPETAALLFRGARIALAGEGPGKGSGRLWPEGRALATLSRINNLVLARAGERWAEVERLASELLRDWRRGDLHQLAFEGRFGVYDPVRGVDPGTSLAELAGRARARSLAGNPSVPSTQGRDR